MKLKDAYIFEEVSASQWNIYKAWHLEGAVYQCRRYAFSVNAAGEVTARDMGITVLDAVGAQIINRQTAIASCEAVAALFLGDSVDYGDAASNVFGEMVP